MTEKTSMQLALDEKLQALFSRPVIAENVELQGVLTSIAYAYQEKLLAQQVAKTALQAGIGAASNTQSQFLNNLLLEEHDASTDVLLVKQTADAKQQLLAFPDDLLQYKSEYLHPKLRERKKPHRGYIDEKVVADYLVGSVIGCVLGSLGEGNQCYVPRTDSLQAPMARLEYRQRELQREIERLSNGAHASKS